MTYSYTHSNEPERLGPKGRSQKIRAAIFVVVMLVLFSISAIPNGDVFQPISIIAAGFVYVRLGKPVRKSRAAFEAGRFTAIVMAVAITLVWIAFGSILLVNGHLPGFLDFSTDNFVGIAIIIAILFFTAFTVVVGTVLGVLGGLIAALVRREKPPATTEEPGVRREPADPNDPWVSSNKSPSSTPNPRVDTSDTWS